MDRRRAITLLGGAGVGALLPTGVWADVARAVSAPAVPGPGPYGALQPPDANGFRLPAGFRSRLLAVTGEPVAGTSHTWHAAPDGGGVVATSDGGWVYVSNSEVGQQGGGVSALRFDAASNVVDSYSILTGTSWNCAGGMTPWGTWLSCEESGRNGKVYECDPLRPGQGIVRPAMGSFNHEAAAVDTASGHVYLTEDKPDGRLYRFEPATAGDLSAGSLFAASVDADGFVTWIPTSPAEPDRQPTTTPFDGGEGIYLGDGVIWFATKGDNRVWELDLATQRVSVAYDCDAHPDGELVDVDNVVVHGPSGQVFVAEDLGNMELAVLAGPPEARTMSIVVRVDGHPGSELAGMDFSPDGTRMYLSSQRGTDGRTGRTYEITGPWGGLTPPPPPEPPPPLPVPVVETVPVAQMAWVRGGSYAGTVMGGGSNQQICFNGTERYSRRTFCSFPITPTEGSYARATLTISARVWTGTGALEVEPAATGWDAATLTWNTQPAVTGPSVGAGPLTSDRAPFRFDVTEVLNAAAATGASSVAFRIRQTRRNGPLGYVDGPARSGAPTLELERSEAPPPPPPVATVTTTLPVARDTYVRGGTDAGSTFASSRLLRVCNNGNPQYTRWAYLGVDVPPLEGAVRQATLRINARLSSGTDSAHEVLVAPGPWQDTALTWDNRPLPSGGPIAAFRIADTDPRWYDLDVTSAVAALGGAGTVTFVVRQTQRNGPLAYVNPTNHWTSDVPELVVVHG